MRWLVTSYEKDNGDLAAHILAGTHWFYKNGPEAVAEVWADARELARSSYAVDLRVNDVQTEFRDALKKHYDIPRPLHAPLLCIQDEG